MRKALVILLSLAVVAALVTIGAYLVSDRLAGELPFTEGCEATVNGHSTSLSLEEAENAALISAVSIQRGMPARAATIALATAFQESGLRNLSGGHLDSVGLFQQRPSQGWGTVEEISDPYYSTNKFYAALAKIDGYTSMEITEAAQRVQKSAAGQAYAQHEQNARTLASSLTGHSSAAFSCAVRSDESTAAQPAALRSELRKAFGRLTFSSNASSAAVGVSRPERGWAVAQWAVANAKRFGITSVSFANQRWTVEESRAGWQVAEAGSGTVRLSFAPAPPT
jgi:hypothetical protein